MTYWVPDGVLQKSKPKGNAVEVVMVADYQLVSSQLKACRDLLGDIASFPDDPRGPHLHEVMARAAKLIGP